VAFSPTNPPTPKYDPGDFIALARADFGIFCVLMFPELHDGSQLIPADYVNLMVEALMSVKDGHEKRLIFNLPPGHMKSLIVSVFFSAWMLGVDPSKRILCTRLFSSQYLAVSLTTAAKSSAAR
jgi:hypothetical protein